MSKGEKTRREIVDRALALAGEVGFEGLSLGMLAASLSLSKSGLFAHFKSKEALQLEVLEEAIDRFVKQVVLPAVSKGRGEPRVRALFDCYLEWIRNPDRAGGCLFMALTQEYDDRPGTVRDLLVQSQQDWLSAIARAARIAVEEEHFAKELDCEQFAFEFKGIGMAYQHSTGLLDDKKADKRARAAFEALLRRSRRAKN